MGLSPLDPIQCQSEHNPYQLFISIIIAFGLLISYLPQHYRIIKNKTSEGISAWYLLLGVVSATACMFNMILLQFNVLRCCSQQPFGMCFENILGILQLMIQWAMFTLIFILFMIYFPENLKLTPYVPQLHFTIPPTTRSLEWRIALGVAAACTIHFIITVVISMWLVFVYGPQSNATQMWAGFLGVSSMFLAALQYLPQIYKTWRRKAVGALSIPMMCIQTPGAFLFVISLSLRPGANWTTWITFLITGLLQGVLLVLCITWHIRAKRLGIDDIYGVKVIEIEGSRADDEGVADIEVPDETTRLLQG
ncbi:uncharacterized protein VTP21DRAFT_3260 [Calcarisporiella thermophila]|uniref:uncharacterized protein n=1 Tax=Calcarisporiella thermophila TaxID=911321 RepID=UPI0037429529